MHNTEKIEPAALEKPAPAGAQVQETLSPETEAEIRRVPDEYIKEFLTENGFSKNQAKKYIHDKEYLLNYFRRVPAQLIAFRSFVWRKTRTENAPSEKKNINPEPVLKETKTPENAGVEKAPDTLKEEKSENLPADEEDQPEVTKESLVKEVIAMIDDLPDFKKWLERKGARFQKHIDEQYRTQSGMKLNRKDIEQDIITINQWHDEFEHDTKEEEKGTKSETQKVQPKPEQQSNNELLTQINADSAFKNWLQINKKRFWRYVTEQKADGKAKASDIDTLENYKDQYKKSLEPIAKPANSTKEAEPAANPAKKEESKGGEPNPAEPTKQEPETIPFNKLPEKIQRRQKARAQRIISGINDYDEDFETAARVNGIKKEETDPKAEAAPTTPASETRTVSSEKTPEPEKGKNTKKIISEEKRRVYRRREAPKNSEEAAKGETAETSKINKILNDKKFIKFLHKYPDLDALDARDEKIVERRYEAFLALPELLKNYADLYNKDLRDKLGIALDKDEFGHLGDILEKEALENPESIIERKKAFEQFQKIPVEIAEAEKEFKNVTEKASGKTIEGVKQFITKLDQQIAALKTAEQASKGWFNFREKKLATIQLQRVNLNVPLTTRNISAKRFEIESNREKWTTLLVELEQIESLKREKDSELNLLRGQIFGNFEGNTKVIEAAQEKLRKTVLESDGAWDGLYEAQEILQSIRQKEGSLGQNTGIEFSNPSDLNEWQGIIDKAIEEKTRNEVENIIRKLPIDNLTLEEFRKALSPYTEEKTLGSKDEEATRRFIAETILDVKAGGIKGYYKRTLFAELTRTRA